MKFNAHQTHGYNVCTKCKLWHHEGFHGNLSSVLWVQLHNTF